MNIAGIVTAQCTCCPTAQPLVIEGHAAECANSGVTYVDRGDGVFVRSEVRERPATKIQLDRATFA